jgi:hypothetical protein
MFIDFSDQSVLHLNHLIKPKECDDESNLSGFSKISRKMMIDVLKY